MLVSFILISIEKPGTKIKQTNAHLNFDLKWVNVTLLLHFFLKITHIEYTTNSQRCRTGNSKYYEFIMNREGWNRGSNFNYVNHFIYILTFTFQIAKFVKQI